MLELFINQLLTDPTFIKNGGTGVLIILFCIFSYKKLENAFEKKVEETIDAKFEIFKKDFQLSINDIIDKGIERQKEHGKSNLENIKKMAIKVIDQRFDKAEKLLEEVLEIEKRIIDKNEK